MATKEFSAVNTFYVCGNCHICIFECKACKKELCCCNQCACGHKLDDSWTQGDSEVMKEL